MKSEVNNIKILKKEDLLSFFLNNLSFSLHPEVYDNVVEYVDSLVKVKMENEYIYKIPKTDLRVNEILFIYKIKDGEYLLFEKEEFDLWFNAKINLQTDNGNVPINKIDGISLEVIKENLYKNTNKVDKIIGNIENLNFTLEKNIEILSSLDSQTTINNSHTLDVLRDNNSKISSLVSTNVLNNKNNIDYLYKINDNIENLLKKIDISISLQNENKNKFDSVYISINKINDYINKEDNTNIENSINSINSRLNDISYISSNNLSNILSILNNFNNKNKVKRPWYKRIFNK